MKRRNNLKIQCKRQVLRNAVFVFMLVSFIHQTPSSTTTTKNVKLNVIQYVPYILKMVNWIPLTLILNIISNIFDSKFLIKHT